MKTTLLTLASLAALASAPAFADVGTVKAQIFTAQSQLKIKGLEARGGGTTFGRDFSKSEQEGDKLNSVGGGAAFEMKLTEPARLGIGVGYINYDGEDNRAGYSDLVGSLYTSVDFFNNDSGSFYGLGGFSYHRLDMDDFSNNGIQVKGDGTDLVNYDLGVGARFKLNYATTFGLEYKYTQTFAKNDVNLDVEAANLSYDGLKYKDVGIENNELQASVGFIF